MNNGGALAFWSAAADGGSGSAPWWLGIVTAVLAGGFALLGVRLNQRHAAEQRRLDRHEDRRVEQREALAEVLATGREYKASLDAVILRAMVAVDAVAFGNSPAVDGHGPLDRAHSRALLTARLVLRDPPVLAYVTRMSELMEEIPKQLPPILNSAKANGKRADVEAAGPALQRAAGYGKALDMLERITRERVVDDPQEARRRWRQRVRLPRRRQPTAPEVDAST
ncbi:hypothetical protein [Geodermatophilus obscurus]|uniref:Uncharacterized protein n=1 Tax=Geodermatophilus obscurus (strain ATCC 25078 / DSM 43160 / JCM 3152 / CCUG 61914 / KCC A-0152 / KCTC 9177 / NBRC 13315 / NRRL B-3577 / G-20) TaxID=526225 RepID=D2SC61_GEOOG|nr:hypothetical protein [Geodermatophilus obscurus]ADB74229.1 hypothetical protein Gobs_1500 [Geodermatophilus obscurus DSM 43160]